MTASELVQPADPTPCTKPGCLLEGQVHPRCTGHKRGTNPPEPCGQRRVRGATKCWMHGVAKGTKGRAAADRRVEQERVGRLLERYPGLSGRDPVEGLQETVDRRWGMVELLGDLVSELSVPAARARVDGDAEDAGDGSGSGVAFGALYGPDHLGNGRPGVVVAMYDHWLERLRQVCKDAIDAGIAERRVRAVEADAMQVAPVLRAVFADLAGRLFELAEAGVLDGPRVRQVFDAELPVIAQRRAAESRPAIEANASAV